MPTNVFRFNFGDAVSMEEAEASLHLAIIAAEGLFGESVVRMDASYHLDQPQRVIVVDASNEVGNAIARIFTRLAICEFGEDAFSVRPLPNPSVSKTKTGVS